MLADTASGVSAILLRARAHRGTQRRAVRCAPTDCRYVTERPGPSALYLGGRGGRLFRFASKRSTTPASMHRMQPSGSQSARCEACCASQSATTARVSPPRPMGRCWRRGLRNAARESPRSAARSLSGHHESRFGTRLRCWPDLRGTAGTVRHAMTDGASSPSGMRWLSGGRC